MYSASDRDDQGSRGISMSELRALISDDGGRGRSRDLGVSGGDKGMKRVREQAEIILNHLEGLDPVDPRFIVIHASTLLQYAAGLERTMNGRDTNESREALV